MALPLSGQISMADIQAELGIGEGDPGYSDFGLDQARSGTYVTLNTCSAYLPPSSGPVSLASWYGYDQNASCSPTYNLYLADEYYCNGTTCEYQQSDVVVALSTAVSPSYTRYYPLQAGGFAYQLTSTTTSGPGAILEVTSYTNCSLACSI